MDTIRILGIAGSLRRGSFNRAALRAAHTLAPIGCTIEDFPLDAIPLFNQDLEALAPAPVKIFKERIRAADAILFVTPEFNDSIPGVLKNAIDWASRPYGDSAWQGKPAAIMGASVMLSGSAGAQSHLRQVLATLDMPTVHAPEVLIRNAAGRFDNDGVLVDEVAKQQIHKLLEALMVLARLHAHEAQPAA